MDSLKNMLKHEDWRVVPKVNLPVILDLNNGKILQQRFFYQLDCAWGLPGLLVSMVSVFLAIN
jgi:hypothetical protein